MEDWLKQAVPSFEKRYPPGWKASKHLSRLVRNILLSASRTACTPSRAIDELTNSCRAGGAMRRICVILRGYG